MDTRQRRSRRALQDALIHLMEVHSLDAIRIVDLIETADVALMTFYRNYKNKLDLLQDILLSLPERLEKLEDGNNLNIERLLDVSKPPPILPLLRYMDAHKGFFRQLILTMHHEDMFRQALNFMAYKIRSDTPEWQAHEAELLAGAIFGYLYQWVMLDMPYSVEEMALIIHRTTLYGVLVQNNRIKIVSEKYPHKHKNRHK